MREIRVIVIKSHGVIAPFIMDGYANGFRSEGHKVLLFNTVKDRLDANQLIAFKPDFVIAYGYCGFIKTGYGYFFREHGIPLVCLHYDCPYLSRDEDVESEIYEHNEFYYEFVWDKWFLSELRNHGAVNNSHILLATDSGIFVPDKAIEASAEAILCFVGRVGADGINSKFGVEIIDNFVEDVVNEKLKNFSMPVMDICKILFKDIKYDAIFKLYKREPNKFWKIIYYKIHGSGSSFLRRHILDGVKWVDMHIYGAGDGWNKAGAVYHENVSYGHELSKVYQKYALNLNITSLQLETSINNRPFDAYASKAFMLNDYRDDMVCAFPDHWEMITYRNLNELAEKGEYYLTHEKERLELVVELNNVTLKKHTYRNRAGQILDTLFSKGFF